MDNPTTSTHSSSKTAQGSSSKSKSDSHYRPQTLSNGSNNNNFLHANNNNKQAPARLDNAMFIDLCDTDDVEMSSKKPKPHKHKHNKKSKDSGPALANSVHLLSQMHPATGMGANAAVSDEVDHNQIIHDLKVNRSFLRKYFDLQL